MKKKRLAKDKIEEISRFLQEGKDAKELAGIYQVSVATIYNIKTRMNKEPVNLPAKKRGRKPKLEKAVIPPTKVKANKQALPGKKRGRKPKNEKLVAVALKTPIDAQKLPASGTMENYSFTINGVTVTVSSKAKKIHIAPDIMVVSF